MRPPNTAAANMCKLRKLSKLARREADFLVAAFLDTFLAVALDWFVFFAAAVFFGAALLFVLRFFVVEAALVFLVRAFEAAVADFFLVLSLFAMAKSVPH